MINHLFEINNLVRHKFETTNDSLNVIYEVMEIRSQTCYAGTQVFYDCRPIHLTKGFKANNDWTVAPGFSTEKSRPNGWVSFREDELIVAPQELIDITLNKKK